MSSILLIFYIIFSHCFTFESKYLINNDKLQMWRACGNNENFVVSNDNPLIGINETFITVRLNNSL